jgi:small subunit ribosomal protein S21
VVQVTVVGNDVAQSLKVLKKKMQREGVFREMKLRRHHEKSSEKRARRQAEAVRRSRKQLRKRLETEGF